jgi:hypothetical protein
MAISPLVPTSPGLAALEHLMEDVRLARADVQALRRAPVVHDRLFAARQSLLRALEAYAEALTVRHLPIPPKLRDELRLQREIRKQRIPF